MKIKAKIDRMVNAGNVKAIASVSLDGMFVVKNLKVMDGKKGLFVSTPQETFTGKDGQKKYSNTFFALTNSAKLELQESVLQAYQQQMDPNYVPRQGYGDSMSPRRFSTSGTTTPSSTRNRSTRTGSMTPMTECFPWIWASCKPQFNTSSLPLCFSQGLNFFLERMTT